jgi:hypothetical protein
MKLGIGLCARNQIAPAMIAAVSNVAAAAPSQFHVLPASCSRRSACKTYERRRSLAERRDKVSRYASAPAKRRSGSGTAAGSGRWPLRARLPPPA